MKIKTQPWADHLKPCWLKDVVPRVCENPVVLEIGSFEGNSACFWIEEMKPKHITCVDTFDGSVEHTKEEVKNLFDIFNTNTEEYQKNGIMTVYRGRSHDVMPTLEKDSFDFIYIDGSHIGSDVMEDAILAHKLIKEGGYILFDDYFWYESRERMSYKNTVKCPKFAIDAFLMLYSDIYTFVCLPGNDQFLIKNISKTRKNLEPN